jgi:hypothetical protein
MIPTYKGTPSTSTFHAGTIFVDPASCFLHFTPNQSTGAMVGLDEKARVDGALNKAMNSVGLFESIKPVVASLF